MEQSDTHTTWWAKIGGDFKYKPTLCKKPTKNTKYYANVIAFFPIFSLLLTDRLQSINITIPKYLLNSMVRDDFSTSHNVCSKCLQYHRWHFMYVCIVHTAIAHLTTCIANTRTLTHVWIIISLHEVNQPQRTCDNSFTIST